MKAGGIIALVAIPVVLGGGGLAAFLLLRKRKQEESPKQQSRDLATAQAIMGPKAVAQGVAPVAPGPPGQPGKAGSASSPYAGQVLGAAGKVMDLWYPGMGTKAANIAKAIDSKIGLGLIAKVPGLKKLKFW